MDFFDDIQIEELENFDFVGDMNEFLFDEEDRLYPTLNSKFDINEYLNGNIDY
jgi:hypothetical protein